MTVKDLLGQKFGRLTIITRSEKKEKVSRQALWDCLCDCGNEVTIRSQSLVNGVSKSCGCYFIERTKNKSNEESKKHAAMNRIFRQYKRGAEKRKHEFLITREKLKELIQQPCSYCGTENSNVLYTKYKETEYLLHYNGIDRKDNSRGYHSDNVVTCCSVCNKWKGTGSLEDFKNHIFLLNERFNDNPIYQDSFGIE